MYCSLELKAALIYKAIYSKEELASAVCKMTVDATAELSDQYGNIAREKAYPTSMDRATADSVNWKNDYAVDFPSVCQLNCIHPTVEQRIAEEQLQEGDRLR